MFCASIRNPQKVAVFLNPHVTFRWNIDGMISDTIAIALFVVLMDPISLPPVGLLPRSPSHDAWEQSTCVTLLHGCFCGNEGLPGKVLGENVQ